MSNHENNQLYKIGKENRKEKSKEKIKEKSKEVVRYPWLTKEERQKIYEVEDELVRVHGTYHIYD